MPPAKYRVLHVIDSFDLGGAQTALLNLLRYADRERFEPEVACMHGRGVFWEQFAALGVPVHSLSPAKWLPLYVWRLARLLTARRFDIVHCHLFGANWIAKPVAALLGVRVRINHDQCNDRLRHDSRWARWLDTATNHLSTHVCAVSKSTRDFLTEREALPAGRVSVIYNGVDAERYTPAKADADKAASAPLVAGVGRLHPQKDFALFLDVAAELARRSADVRFVIAGTGPEEASLKAKAAALGLAGRVRFAGHVADPRTIYAATDVLLLTSRYEGTPLTVLEAMASGVPVVAPKLDGLEEILVDGADCFLVPPGASGEFADRVADLLASPELRARFAAAARAKVAASFSAETMAAQVERIYISALEEAGEPGRRRQ
ncbi:MAG: glycosyltransferase [Chthoniobacter sp.]|nr:glycosyltransferase [Chthoniobacter sp.]